MSVTSFPDRGESIYIEEQLSTCPEIKFNSWKQSRIVSKTVGCIMLGMLK